MRANIFLGLFHKMIGINNGYKKGIGNKRGSGSDSF